VDTHGKWLGRKGYWNDLSRSLKWTKADEKYYFSKIAPDIVLLCAKWQISDVDPPERRYAKKGGGRFRPDRPFRPATGLAPELLWDFPLMKELMGLGFTGRGGSARRKGHLLLIEFDLKWPLKDQLDFAKRILKRALDNYNLRLQERGKRKPTGRRRFDDYDAHLKAWDLSQRGKSHAQIAQKLFPLDHGDSALQKVRDHVDAAQLVKDIFIPGPVLAQLENSLLNDKGRQEAVRNEQRSRLRERLGSVRNRLDQVYLDN
jgi:hypothetical protein